MYTEQIIELNEELRNLQRYSETETYTGRVWIDGKPIYRKIIDFGALPNNTEKDVAHNISSISDIVKIEGVCRAIEDDINVYGSLSSTALITLLGADETNVIIISNEDRSSYTAFVILEYTKSI